MAAPIGNYELKNTMTYCDFLIRLNNWKFVANRKSISLFF